MSSILGKKVFGGAAATPASKSAVSGGAKGLCQAYYQRYIATSSAAPIFHAIAFYSAVHWTITQTHKHSQNTDRHGREKKIWQTSGIQALASFGVRPARRPTGALGRMHSFLERSGESAGSAPARSYFGGGFQANAGSRRRDESEANVRKLRWDVPAAVSRFIHRSGRSIFGDRFLFESFEPLTLE